MIIDMCGRVTLTRANSTKSRTNLAPISMPRTPGACDYVRDVVFAQIDQSIRERIGI
jgi:hypothetical protein